MSSPCTTSDVQSIEEVFRRLAGDLSLLADRTLAVHSVAVERARARATGRGRVHISFKLGIQRGAEILHGALLAPLPDAISLAGYLMMMPDEAVVAERASTKVEGAWKDALLELGNFVAGATEAALRPSGLEGIRVRSESCQGVKPDVPPAFVHVEGAELLVGRAEVKLHTFPAFEMILMLPVL